MRWRNKHRWDGAERRDPPMVLVVGENPDANELLSRLLTGHGYRSVTATSHDTATARATEQLPRAAVVDAGGIGGSLHLLDWFRGHDDERLARCRVVMVASSPSNRIFAFQSGADDFLLRPFHADDLLASLQTALDTPGDQLALRRRELIQRAES